MSYSSVSKLPAPRRWRTEIAASAVLAAPIVGGQVLTIVMNVIDTALAGHLGTDVLAAVAMGNQAWVLAILIVIGTTLAITPSVAQLDGAGRRDEVGAVFRQGLWLALMLGIALGVAVHRADTLLALANVAPSIRPAAGEFMRAISWGAPAFALFYVCKNTSEGLSLTRPTLYFAALGVILLGPLAYALMYGRLGLPRFGAAGAGMAHAITMWVQALCFMAYLRLRRAHYGDAALYAKFEWPRLAPLFELLRVGVPMGMSVFMEGSLFVATALLAGSFGETHGSAHIIAINVGSVAFMIPLGLAMATTVRVGNAVGARDAQGVAWAAGAGMVLTLGMQLISAAVMMFAPRTLIGLYTTDVAVAALAARLLWLAGVFQISDGIQVLCNGALRGLKDTVVPAAITLLAYWGVGMTVAWWLGVHRGGQTAGLWIGLIAGLTVAAALLALRFASRARRLLRQGFADIADEVDADPAAPRAL